MCGIVGIIDTQGERPIDRVVLSRMNEAQVHRGPDEGGIHIEPGVGLAHRRLSIIDLTSGQQPLFNEDRSVVVVYNGEIYNFQELTEELRADGHIFRTHCDTEVIVHAWEQWGEACVERFRGMFVFAIWDRNRQTLFLARDRLGIKPLYYTLLSNGQLLFGSELKALTENPEVLRVIDPCAVEDYFTFGYIPEPRTIYRNTFKLSPGYTLTIKRGASIPEPRQYWDVPFRLLPVMDEHEAAEELVQRLREAVEIRLISEVPLGAFLSGGIDSSAVVAMMAGLSKNPVATCSISFGDPSFNEAHYAEKVAQRYGANHRAERVDVNDFHLVDELVRLYDEPYADSSAMPTYQLCKLAKKNVTVALSGDGGDENLAGYRRYLWHIYEERMRSVVPAVIRRPLFRVLGHIYPKADWAPRIFRAKSTFEAIARDTMEGYLHNVSIFGENQRARLFSEQLRKDLHGYRAVETLRYHTSRAPTDHPLSLVQYLDMKTYLVGDILTKVDRASMAHSLEVRVPILDHKFVEWLSGLPHELKLRGQGGKYIFKKALRPYLSDDILYRPKMGFAVPLATWFRGPLREKVLNAIQGPNIVEAGFFNQSFLNELLDQHQSGTRDHSAKIWSLLMFESFLKREIAGT